MFSNSKAGRGARLSLRSPQVRLVAGTVVAALAVSSFAFSGTTSGAATLPNSQAVGRFLDGSLGTNPVQTIADVKDARAVSPGATSVQNPLDVKLLNALDLPLTGALQLSNGHPLLGITLGAVNQVAQAHPDGYSYGASGAVANDGGVSAGATQPSYPANATINLSASGIAGNAAAAGDILGGVSVNVGAVSALASTPVGVAQGSSTKYQIAGLTVNAGSPLLGKVLSPLLKSVSGLLAKLASIPALPTGCSISVPALSQPISLEGGGIILDPSTGGLTIDLEALLKTAGLDLNKLPANTDLLQNVITYLTSPDGLKTGLDNVLFNDLLTPLNTGFQGCITALNNIPVLGAVLSKLLTTLTKQLPTLQKLVDTVALSLGKALGSAPLAKIVSLLEKLVDIGVNVQPNGAKGTYTDQLKATPNQNTPVVPGQTVVRAIEVNLLGNAINLALANAAAGPSNPAAVVTTPPASSPPASNIPTGVPAGFGTKGGTPALPLILLIVGLLVAGGGVTAQRLRFRRNH